MFFLFSWAVLLVGWVVHVFVDRSPEQRTRHRVLELALLWVMVGGGVWAVFGGIGHIGPNSENIAETIGYRQSMFQWEVGWGDIAVGVLGIGCAWRRDGWLTAAVATLAISYGGDAIGHVMQWSAHANTAPDNIWAIPGDLVSVFLAVGLLVAYRIGQRRAEVRSVEVDVARLEAAAGSEVKRPG